MKKRKKGRRQEALRTLREVVKGVILRGRSTVRPEMVERVKHKLLEKEFSRKK